MQILGKENRKKCAKDDSKWRKKIRGAGSVSDDEGRVMVFSKVQRDRHRGCPTSPFDLML